MKQLNVKILIALLLTGSLVFLACQKEKTASVSDEVSLQGVNNVTGNNAPSGAHYNLNIIGVPKNKTATMDGNNGRRIFVKLDGNTKIYLTMGEFAVLDANGTDNDGATFQLPAPDPDNNGITEYSVWARAVGKPGGSSILTTCATGTGSNGQDSTFCSTENLVSVRSKGPAKFENVSKQLLYIYADIDLNGTIDRVPLFSDDLEDYYWNYDNYGLKNLQLRFYEIPTNVN